MNKFEKPDSKDNNEASLPSGQTSETPAAEENSLVDIFEEEDSGTRRINMEDFKSAGFSRVSPQPTAEAEEEEPELTERDYRPIRFRRDSRLGCLGGLMYAVFIISISIIFACFGWMCASDLLGLSASSESVTVTIPDSAFSEKEVEITDEDGNVTGYETVSVADMDYVAGALKDSGIIDYKWLFKLFGLLSNADSKIDQGTYELSTDDDYRAIIKNLQYGTQSMVITTQTFPEGYTMAQIFAQLEEANVCSAEDLFEAAANFEFNDYRFLENAETGDAIRLEGFIFPNTYDFYEGEPASTVIDKFLSALNTRISADMYKQGENIGLTMYKAFIVASVIEKEAANDAERATIASVIYNRINAGMTLGIDATILYEFPDYDGGVNLPTEILTFDSPYNTHLYTGLPPTPICNPGIASLQAALQPDYTDYYYYALDTETGTHRFFANYNEFEAFVATQNYDEET